MMLDHQWRQGLGALALASDMGGIVRFLSYVHQDGLRVSEINVRTLALRSVNLADKI